MTKQEIFDTIVNHLRRQGCKSISRNGQCCYRGPHGTKCAIGCLISDDDYQPEMEGFGVLSLVERWPCVLNDTLNYFLLRACQKIHDDTPIHRWEAKFKLIAQRFNLVYEVP